MTRAHGTVKHRVTPERKNQRGAARATSIPEVLKCVT
jgi:hypothetical protein